MNTFPALSGGSPEDEMIRCAVYWRVGDEGQRYEIVCDEHEGGPQMGIGWSDSPDAFREMVDAHPSWCNHRAIDRRPDPIDAAVDAALADPTDKAAIDRLVGLAWKATGGLGGLPRS